VVRPSERGASSTSYLGREVVAGSGGVDTIDQMCCVEAPSGLAKAGAPGGEVTVNAIQKTRLATKAQEPRPH